MYRIPEAPPVNWPGGPEAWEPDRVGGNEGAAGDEGAPVAGEESTPPVYTRESPLHRRELHPAKPVTPCEHCGCSPESPQVYIIVIPCTPKP